MARSDPGHAVQGASATKAIAVAKTRCGKPQRIDEASIAALAGDVGHFMNLPD